MIKKIMFVWGVLLGTVNADPSIPEQIRVPIGNKPVLSAHAKGDQIYQCSVDNNKYFWKIQAPDARLYDAQGQIVGNHYAGPIWEYKEGSRVVGRIVNKVDIAPETSISWLLVEVIEHKGSGLFSNVKYINRVNTHGGLPPLSGCDANHLGSEKRVPYTADYIFYAD
ncbi:DUF3455 domain-containing protein [Methylobacter sp. BlB1]|uniref:DUF3455 domain-containing protein n=1 Tax=Methylobacter sp. BlB1 TaxID=2785914 RepID=UPI0018959AEA|nr:DUF3455 domain-containing protein [Methylobacter sp. BlB1]MBF6650375.1 DUF3455 domain-containing protein [Methylobacter sp. BlB1]